MATFKPVGQAPTRVKFNSESTDSWNLSWNWQSWFETVRQNLVDIRDFTLMINPSTVSANTTEEQSFTTNEVEEDDIILSVNKPTHTTGLGIVGYRAGSNQIHITFGNFTGSGIDPSEEDYLVAVLKR
jgi:hypothetical protein